MSEVLKSSPGRQEQQQPRQQQRSRFFILRRRRLCISPALFPHKQPGSSCLTHGAAAAAAAADNGTKQIKCPYDASVAAGLVCLQEREKERKHNP